MKKLKDILKRLIEEEENVSTLEVKGASLEETLQKASDELGIGLSELEYEIVEIGNSGIFGVGKKDFIIKVYKAKSNLDILSEFKEVIEGEEPEIDDFTLSLEQEMKDKDGEALIRVTGKGVLLKIIPPKGRGKTIPESELYNIITTRGLSTFDKDQVKKVLKQANGEYIKIGEMPLNVINDSQASVQITPDEMKAFITLVSPKSGGFDLEIDDIKNILKSNGVVVGIKDDVLNKIMDYPRYNEPVVVAEGIKVKNGRDALINYNFNVNKDEIHLAEEDGKVDFKNLNIIQNIVAGQILANKEPATRGEAGRTVTNKLIPAKEGREIQLVSGKNTHLSNDGMQIIAEKNGQVMLYAGKVTVEEILTIQGDVNLKTGNITFLGTVLVQGNVEDGFHINASGNLEIHGSVGKCNLEADGDIIINQGYMGKGEGSIRAGKSIYAKFIENAKRVEANEGVYVQDGIMGSHIDATKEITCIGKRGTIVGGRLRAGELVKSKNLGSPANVFTTIEVGVDPKKRQALDEFNEEKGKAYKEYEPIYANFSNLDNLRKNNRSLYNTLETSSFHGILKRMSNDDDRGIFLGIYEENEETEKFHLKDNVSDEMKKRAKEIMGKAGYLPPDKEELYANLKEQTDKLQDIIKKCELEIEEIEKYLAGIKSNAKIIGSVKVYPGVKIYIKSAFLEIRTEYKKVSFFLQGAEVNVAPYVDEEKEETSKRR